MPKQDNGFTLIEILVAIAIIGVVFGVIINSVEIIRRNARDTRRQSDLRNIQSALQQYYADRQSYPPLNSLPSPFNDCSGVVIEGGGACAPKHTYLLSVPKDPSTNQPYSYRPMVSVQNQSATCNQNCHYYILCAKMEGSSTNADCSTFFPSMGLNYQLNP